MGCNVGWFSGQYVKNKSLEDKNGVIETGNCIFGTEKLNVSMFIRLDFLCHLVHDVKKNIADSGKLSISQI